MVKILGIKLKIICLIVGIILCSGCEKTSQIRSEIIANVPAFQSPKTHLEPDTLNRLFDVIWDKDDQVKVFDQNGRSSIYVNTNRYLDDYQEVAYFEGEGIDISSTINAFYPPSIANSSNGFTLPYEQKYRSKSDGYMFEFPMWAQEVNGNHVWFRNLTGILILRMKGPEGTTIRRVTVKDPSDPRGRGLRGSFTVSASGSTHTNEPAVSSVSQLYDISLNCLENPTILGTGMSLFYLSVPEGPHTRLLIGLEYKLPGSPEWTTTYQLAHAQTYGAQHFFFKRSKWIPIDLDFSDLDGSLIYSTKNINLDPRQNGDTVISTDIPLTTSFGEYTFTLDITPDDLTSTDANGYYRKTIYSEMDLVQSDWKGIIIRLGKQNNRGDTKLEVAIGNSTSLFSTSTLSSGVRHQYVVTVQNYSGTYGRVRIYFMRNGVITNVSTFFRKSDWISSEDPAPEIGGDQHMGGRYYDGQLHSFKIYNRVWSTQEINRFIQQ